MEGKKKCELLKEIRKNIANKNGIDYEPDNCEYKKSCSGTCPKCDAEAEQLLDELKQKNHIDTSGNIELLDTFETQNPLNESDIEEVDSNITRGLIVSQEEPQFDLVFDPESGDFIRIPSQRKDNGEIITEIPDTGGFA